MLIDQGTDRIVEIVARLLQYGDKIAILSHSQIVADAEVIEGTSEVDESMLTGESVPVFKTAGSPVVSGTVNRGGKLRARVSRLPGKNTITDIANWIKQAQSFKPHVQDLTVGKFPARDSFPATQAGQRGRTRRSFPRTRRRCLPHGLQSQTAASRFLVDHFLQFNDILSLLVGLWGIRVATGREATNVYTYGWRRAETLGALINGVFLVALCMSIFLEAIQLGCTGLASNFPGMVFLHEHEEPEPGANNIANTLFDQDEIDVHSVPQQARGLRRATTLSQISVQPTALRADIIAAGQPHAVPGSSEQQDENTELRTGPQQRKRQRPRPEYDRRVLGDAVGNIGVIASALYIWLTDFSRRFYADPAVSVIITAIILHTAIPLCTAASRIPLEAVPEGINIDEIKQDINTLPRIADCHALHVSQLSDSNVIATVHIEVDYKVIKDSHEQYMQLASAIRDCLSAFGIHSAPIQPEFFASAAERTSAHGNAHRAALS
ncbi:Zinc resistance conferring protein [Exophiala xenobiotica]|nr:Zinc resistance conferring protein [Exophiala xenobiotica]